MNKYIDAEKLIALLEQRKKQLARWTDKEYANQRIDEIDCILDVDIDSLQQEQSKVDLEKEIATWIPSHITGGEEGVWKECREAVTKWAGIVARHFYELGLKARKEE